MTQNDAVPGPAASRWLPQLVRELFRREPIFAGAALGLAMLVAPTFAAMALDDRLILDVSVWLKPLKFELSLMLFLGTLAWFAGWLPRGTTRTPWYRVFAVAVVVCAAIEMVWLIGSSAIGVAAHFNDTQPFWAAVYPLMGVLAVFITSATLLYAWLLWSSAAGGLNPAFRLSLVTGLVLTFILTVTVAPYLAGHGSHFVGGNMSDAEGMFLTGWARDGGDLRVAHFFATHAMQIIPAFGFAAGLLLQARLAKASVVVFAAAFTGLVAYTFLEALAGRPFLTTLT